MSPINVQFDEYNLDLIKAAQKKGMYESFSLTDGERIVGFLGFYIVPDLHMQGTQAVVESLWVNPRYRGRGGFMLLRKGLFTATTLGCKAFSMTLPYGTHPKFGRLFTHKDVVYTRPL